MKWAKKKLGQISEKVDYGYTASAGNLGVKFLRITDIQNGKVDWEMVPRIECSKIEKYALASGDLVFARTGATTGKSFLIEECPEDAVFASYLIRVRPNKAEVFPKYLSFFFNTPNYWGQISSSATGATLPGVNSTKLKELQIPLPTLPTQRRIAAILDQADALRRKDRELLDKYGELVQAVFLEMFGDPAINPKAWEKNSLGKIALKFNDGPFGSNLKTSHYVDKGVRVIRLQNIGVGEFLDRDEAYISYEHYDSVLKKYTCKKGDVLIGTMGTPNLRACMFPETLEVAVNKADCLRLKPDPKLANGQFITHLINTETVQTLVANYVHGQTRGRISKGQLEKLLIPVPPLNLQSHFAEMVKNIESQKAKGRQQIAQSEALFQSLLQRAFRGELVH